ncbi:MAG: anaerobic ribonucleoside-triphosphate reductase activating protein [Candidatus Ancillula sp.]|nr:anaerobic ribonucleoside-triphosphate reductase activating protein [Candidatus Ancillula sp.]
MPESAHESSANRESLINIAGWSKLSTVDWPGEIVVTLFLQGCPWRCNYCHNSAILDPHAKGEVSFEDDVLKHLENRVGLLDGVVFSGGEPLMQSGEDGGKLLRAMKEVLKFKDPNQNQDAKEDAPAFKIGMHTGGAIPGNLRPLLSYLDWVGFDVKAPTGLYDAITQIKGSESAARKSLNLLLEEREFRKNSARPLHIQFRTTVDPTVLNASDVDRLKEELHEKGIDDLVIQEVRTQGAPEGYAARLSEALSN